MANPYYIEPAGSGVGQALSGIGAIIGKNAEKKRQEQLLAQQEEEQAELMRIANQEAMAALSSGDPYAVMAASQKYPFLSENMERAMSMGGDLIDRQRDDEKRFYQDILSNPAMADSIAAERVQMLQAGNRNADQATELLSELENPETRDQALATVQNMYAMRYPDEFNSFREAIAGPGSGETTAFQTLKQRALASGLQEGTPEYQAFMAQGGQSGSDLRERRIQDYMGGPWNYSRSEAIERVDSDIITDDSGNMTIWNPITQQGTRVDASTGEETPVYTRPEGTETSELSFDPAEGTGFWRSFQGVWNNTIGQAIPSLTAQGPEAAAQNLRLLERDAISALGSSGRPPVVEQERIAALLPKAMDWFENPEIARLKTTNFVDLMMTQYIDDKRFYENRDNPRPLREESQARAQRIESIVRRVLTPEAAQGAFQSLNRVEGEIGELRQMPYEEIITLDPADMTDSQLDIYIERLNSGR